MAEPLTVTTARDCEAILIPVGTPIMVPAGSLVYITQSLGGSYTININGNLARVAPKDADALGMEATAGASVDDPARRPLTGDGTVDEALVWGQLKTCYDPEIPIDIVELGLVYKCEITPKQGGGNHVEVLMTLTAPGCGMGEFLAEDVRNKVAQVGNVTSVNVELTFDPPWSQEMMSEAARLATGMY